MRYTTFGRNTGLRVSELALGTGSFGTGWGHGAEPAEARRLYDRYLGVGGNFIDTADTYQNGESETLLGEFIASERDRLVVASKYTLGVNDKVGIAVTGNSRKAMRAAVEGSLRRLRTDYLDLYWVHMADGLTPVEEIVRGLDDLVRAGKILYAGLSDFPAWRAARAATLAELRGWAPIAGLQFEYSLVERTPDRELLPMAEGLGLAAALWSPLGGGFLTGKYRRGEEGRLQHLGRLVHGDTTEQKTRVLDTVLAVAGELDAEPGQVAIAWLRHRAARSSTTLIPILGANNLAQLEGNLGALQVELSDEQAQRLERVSAVALGFPHEALSAEGYGLRIAAGRPELLAARGAPAA